MSDTYNFLNLSATEEMESPADGTMALVLDEGAVKRVPASQFGGGGFVVTVFFVDEGQGDDHFSGWRADKSFEEIGAAIEGGASPVAVVDLTPMFGATAKFFVPIVAYTIENVMFYSENSAFGVSSVEIYPDDSVGVSMSFLDEME